MNQIEADRLMPGLYELTWVGGGSSMAAVGMLHDGTRWFAPCNWSSGSVLNVGTTRWQMVECVDIIGQHRHDGGSTLGNWQEPVRPAPEPEAETSGAREARIMNEPFEGATIERAVGI